MQTYSIKWNCSGNLAGVFVCKSSPRKRHNWRSAVGFLINAAFLNVYFILEYHLFFRKDFQFRIIIFHWIRYSNVFFLFFGWEVSHPLCTYTTEGMKGVHPKYVLVHTGGEGYYASCVRTHLHYLFSSFCLMLSSFICKNLILPSFKNGVYFRNAYFSPMKSISFVIK